VVRGFDGARPVNPAKGFETGVAEMLGAEGALPAVEEPAIPALLRPEKPANGLETGTVVKLGAALVSCDPPGLYKHIDISHKFTDRQEHQMIDSPTNLNSTPLG
jgi:hypothetical protein